MRWKHRHIVSLPIKKDKGKNSFFAEKIQVLLKCEANEHDKWPTADRLALPPTG